MSCLTTECQSCVQKQSTIRQRIMKVKGRPKMDELKGVVYSIPCECRATYIGETGWNLNTRVQEHKRGVCKGDTNNGIAVHVLVPRPTLGL